MAIKLKGTSKSAKKKQPKERNASPTPWIIAFSIATILAIGGSVGFYFLGRTHGNNDGIWSGYNTGYDDGYKVGRTDGYNSGYTIGNNVGYDNGYKDGYKKAGCVIYGGALCY